MTRQIVSCVVPARLESVRFPYKLLRPLAGVPVIVHSLRRAQEAECFDRILCLTDSPDIAAAARAEGFEALLAGEARNGTERIARSLREIDSDLIVDLQGDEPVFPPEVLRDMVAALRAHPEWVHVPVHAGELLPEILANPHRVKAGIDAEGFIVDFYRDRPRLSIASSRIQMGAYGYSKGFLAAYAALKPSARELTESHELLRDPGLRPMRSLESHLVSQAVDVPQDMEAALALLPQVAAGANK